jgi:hypothetical protein
LNGEAWNNVENAFEKRDTVMLLKNLLKFDLFPIKDSYVAYLKRDKNALECNPAPAARLSGRLYEMGLDVIYARCIEPKETNLAKKEIIGSRAVEAQRISKSQR